MPDAATNQLSKDLEEVRRNTASRDDLDDLRRELTDVKTRLVAIEDMANAVVSVAASHRRQS